MGASPLSGWSFREFVDKKTGRIYRNYAYKGRVCKRIVLDSPLAKQLAGYVLIEKDLRNASIWLSKIEELRGDDVHLDKLGHQRSPDRERYDLIKALTVAALTFYGKAFAQAEGRRIKLERRHLEQEFHKAHDEAIRMRNNFAAHSGKESPESSRIIVALPAQKKILPNLYRELEQPDWFVEIEGNTFKDLVAHAHLISKIKIEELERKIMEEEILPKGYSYWKEK